MHGGAPSALLAHAIEQTEPGGGAARDAADDRVPRRRADRPRRGRHSLAKPGGAFRSSTRRLTPAVVGLPGARGAPAARRHARRRGRCRRLVDQSRCPAPEQASHGRSSSRATRGSSIPTRARSRSSAASSARATRSPGSACAASCCRASRRRRSPVPARPRTSRNGLSWILPFEDWLFVNTELTVHLHREPVGEWIGLDAQTNVGGAPGSALRAASCTTATGASGPARRRCSCSAAERLAPQPGQRCRRSLSRRRFARGRARAEDCRPWP